MAATQSTSARNTVSAFHNRVRKPIGCDERAVGGLFKNFPADLLTHRDWFVRWFDFTKAADYDATNDWAHTAVTSGTAAITTDTANGVLTCTPAAADNNGSYDVFTAAGGSGEAFLPAAGRTIIQEWRVTCGDWDGQDYFLGLSATGALIGADGSLGSLMKVGFHHTIADAGLIQAHHDVDGSSGVDVGDMNSVVFTNDEYHRLGFRLEGLDFIEFYLDGVRVHRTQLATAITPEGIAEAFGNIGSGAATDTLHIDYILTAQTR